jgi:two-component system, chemotaxis family, chemotaxis protein CheY
MMIDLDSELAEDYLAESRDHLDTIETDLLALEGGGVPIDEERANRMFRAVHSVTGGAGVFQLVKIGELARQTEKVLALIRSSRLALTSEGVRVLLRATDKLCDLIQNPGASNQADIAELIAALGGLYADHRPSIKAATGQAHPNGMPLRMLLVEDDFASRLLLQTFLSRYGECHVAVNGREAVEAVRNALAQEQKYDLICMDIMMPEMDGREAVRQIRALEEGRGTLSPYGAKIIMTTAVDDMKEVFRCFKELCDAYLVKPIDLSQLLNQMKACQLIP